MNRKEAAELLPIIQAYVEGKNIQYNSVTSGWCDITESDGLPMGFLEEKPSYFRIKPESAYRPFTNPKECWKEMEEHQPFGWVKDKKDGHHALITAVDDDTCGMSLNGNAAWSLSEIMDLFTFADGTPFGVKEEE